MEKPDERSIVTYLATLCDTLESEKNKSPKRPASPSKTSPKKSPSPSKGAGNRTLSPEPVEQDQQLKKSPSKGGDGRAGSSSPTPPRKQVGAEGRTVSPSPTSPRKQTEKPRKSTSPVKAKDQRTPSPAPPSGNGKVKANQGKLSTSNSNEARSGTPSPSTKSSTPEEPMEISSSESNLSPHKRRDARSMSPTPKSSAPKKPRISTGKLAVSSDHSDRLKSKRLSLVPDSKKLSVSVDAIHKKRASVAGTLTTSRKVSATAPTPMDVESSSSELEESEVCYEYGFYPCEWKKIEVCKMVISSLRSRKQTQDDITLVVYCHLVFFIHSIRERPDVDFSNALKLFGPVFLKTRGFLGVTLYYMLYVYYSKGITALWNECFFFRFFFS